MGAPKSNTEECGPLKTWAGGEVLWLARDKIDGGSHRLIFAQRVKFDINRTAVPDGLPWKPETLHINGNLVESLFGRKLAPGEVVSISGISHEQRPKDVETSLEQPNNENTTDGEAATPGMKAAPDSVCRPNLDAASAVAGETGANINKCAGEGPQTNDLGPHQAVPS